LGDTCGGIPADERKGRKKLFLFTAHLLEKGIYSEIFSESKFILSLTKTKKELRQAPIPNWGVPIAHLRIRSYVGT
jgi:hypothetical protein